MRTPADSLRAFVARHGPSVPFEPVPGVLVLGGGKGGVGTSTVAALLALAGARGGMRVLLVDGDEHVGALTLMFGASDAPGIGVLRGGDRTVRELVVPVEGGLSLLPGGSGGVEATLAGATGERRALFRRIAGLYPDFDLVVVDGGSRLESVTAAATAGAERLLAVMAPDRIALAAGYALLKVVGARHPGLPVEVLVNGRTGTGARAIFQIVESACRNFLDSSPGFAGGVPEDPELRLRIAGGMAMTEAVTRTEALDAARSVLGRIRAEQDAAAATGARAIPIAREG